jgi:hypothetical protein
MASTKEARIPKLQQLEQLRNSHVILYATSDRRGLETKIASDVLPFFIDHLDIIGDVDKISLVLYTHGGETLVAWSLVNLIRNFCKDFEVIVPFHCHSAGTLICLGADRIVMTKQATLGPIDPSVNGMLNPKVTINNQEIRVPVNVEFINGFIEMARNDLKIRNDSALASILNNLSNQVHPLSLGEVHRTKAQIQMLARKLLKHQQIPQKKQTEIINFLCKESGSHDYTIYRREAHDELGLTIEKPNDLLYSLIKGIYNDIKIEMELDTPFDLNLMLAQNTSVSYSFHRAIIETNNGGSDIFVSEGNISKQVISQQIMGADQLPFQMNQVLVQDTRKFEGWRHFR